MKSLLKIPTDLEISNAVNFCMRRGYLPGGLHFRIAFNHLGKKGVEVWSDKNPEKVWISPVEIMQAAQIEQKLGGRRIEL